MSKVVPTNQLLYMYSYTTTDTNFGLISLQQNAVISSQQNGYYCSIVNCLMKWFPDLGFGAVLLPDTGRFTFPGRLHTKAAWQCGWAQHWGYARGCADTVGCTGRRVCTAQGADFTGSPARRESAGGHQTATQPESHTRALLTSQHYCCREVHMISWWAVSLDLSKVP